MANQKQIIPRQIPNESAGEVKKITFENDGFSEISKISLWLDTYDDIFSDFDSRPYLHRSLSDDFLAEIKKVLREKKSDSVDLTFLIPEKERNLEIEGQIMKRLKEYFRKHLTLRKLRFKKSKNRIKTLIFFGFLMLLSSTSISYYNPKIFIFYLLITFFELGGWLSIWFGLEEFIYTSKEKRQEIEFYEKMFKAKIKFIVYQK